MPVLNIVLDAVNAGDAWPETASVPDDKVIHLGNDAPPICIAGLGRGMTSGKPSVMIRIDLPDGRLVLAETSLALFLTAAEALKARHGDPRTEEPPRLPRTT